jgi:hypothetical protein
LTQASYSNISAASPKTQDNKEQNPHHPNPAFFSPYLSSLSPVEDQIKNNTHTPI